MDILGLSLGKKDEKKFSLILLLVKKRTVIYIFQSCTEVKVDGEKSRLFRQDEEGQWICPQCDYVVKTKFIMSKHLK